MHTKKASHNLYNETGMNSLFSISKLIGNMFFDSFSEAITHDGADVTCSYYSLARTALDNILNLYEYMVYLFDSLPYKKDSEFDYSPYLPWAEGIRKRIEEHMRKRLPNP